MSLRENMGALTKAKKELFLRWMVAKEAWSDAQSREFEKVYIDQIEQDVRAAMGAMTHMDEVLQKLKSECA